MEHLKQRKFVEVSEGFSLKIDVGCTHVILKCFLSPVHILLHSHTHACTHTHLPCCHTDLKCLLVSCTHTHTNRNVHRHTHTLRTPTCTHPPTHTHMHTSFLTITHIPSLVIQPTPSISFVLGRLAQWLA